jgi:4-hydroxy-tetrahydrodipicolinate synthase
MIHGAFTLLITPFDENLKLDENGLRDLVQRQIENGIDGIAPLGVTGESPALTEEEMQRVVEIIVEEAGEYCKIAPDTCSNNLEECRRRIQMFADKGCDYAVVFAPFLVKPLPPGIVDFYENLADFSPLPLIIHNAPARVGINIEPETYARLAENKNIIGTKDGNKQMDHLAKIIFTTRNSEFSVFTGKDTTAYPLMSFGGSGVFTVAGNIIPRIMRDLISCCLKKEYREAQEIHYEYYELFEALRMETNPMATKEALRIMGLPGGRLRPPHTGLSRPKTRILEKQLQKKGLI